MKRFYNFIRRQDLKKNDWSKQFDFISTDFCFCYEVFECLLIHSRKYEVQISQDKILELLGRDYGTREVGRLIYAAVHRLRELGFLIIDCTSRPSTYILNQEAVRVFKKREMELYNSKTYKEALVRKWISENRYYNRTQNDCAEALNISISTVRKWWNY